MHSENKKSKKSSKGKSRKRRKKQSRASFDLVNKQSLGPLVLHSKASLLTLGGVEGKCSIYCRMPGWWNGQLTLQSVSVMAFREAIKKVGVGAAGCMISSCTAVRLVGIKGKFPASSTF